MEGGIKGGGGDCTCIELGYPEYQICSVIRRYCAPSHSDKISN